MHKISLSPKRPPQLRPWFVNLHSIACALVLGGVLVYLGSAHPTLALVISPLLFLAVWAIGWTAGSFSGYRKARKITYPKVELYYDEPESYDATAAEDPTQDWKP